MEEKITRIINREIVLTIISVFMVVLTFFGFSYAFFLDVKEGTPNTIAFGNIELSFYNNGNLIGTTTENNNTIPVLVYPSSFEEEITKTPYTFSLKNTGDYSLHVTLKLIEDEEVELSDDYSDYKRINKNNITIGLRKNQTEELLVNDKYSNFIDNSLYKDIVLSPDEEATYDLFAWVSDDAQNDAQGTYFFASMQAIGEYIPVSSIEG